MFDIILSGSDFLTDAAKSFPPLNIKFDSPADELSNFTNRVDELDVFSRALKIPSGETLPVISYYGVGGTGKTWLLKRLQSSLDGIPCARIDLDPNQGAERLHNDVGLLLAEIRGQFSGIPCPSFDVAFQWLRYHQNRGKGGKFPGQTFLGDAWEIIVDEVIAKVPGGKPIYNMLASQLAEPVLEKLGKSRILKWLGSKSEHVEDFLRLKASEPDQILLDLHRRLLFDLKSNLPERFGFQCKGVIFVDTFESLGSIRDSRLQRDARQSWIRDLYHPDSGVLLVIAGRDRINWDLMPNSPFADTTLFDQHLVGGLSEQDARQLLENCNVNDPVLQDAVLATCIEKEEQNSPNAYHCFSLGLCADSIDTELRQGNSVDPESFKISPGDTVRLAQRFLRSLPDETYESWILNLATIPKFDEQAARYSFSEHASAEQDAAWLTLNRFSFVSRDERDWFAFHAVMREALLGLFSESDRAKSDDRWTQYWSKRIKTEMLPKLGQGLEQYVGVELRRCVDLVEARIPVSPEIMDEIVVPMVDQILRKLPNRWQLVDILKSCQDFRLGARGIEAVLLLLESGSAKQKRLAMRFLATNVDNSSLAKKRLEDLKRDPMIDIRIFATLAQISGQEIELDDLCEIERTRQYDDPLDDVPNRLIETLKRILEHQNNEIRIWALKAIPWMSHEYGDTLMPAVFKCVQASHPEDTASVAVQALKHVNVEEAGDLGTLIAKHVADNFDDRSCLDLKSFLNDHGYQQRVNQAARRIIDNEDEEYLTFAIEELAEQTGDTEILYAHEVKNLRETDAFTPGLAKMSRSEKHVASLYEFYRDPDIWIQMNAAEVLLAWGEPVDVLPLLKAINDMTDEDWANQAVALEESLAKAKHEDPENYSEPIVYYKKLRTAKKWAIKFKGHLAQSDQSALVDYLLELASFGKNERTISFKEVADVLVTISLSPDQEDLLEEQIFRQGGDQIYAYLQVLAEKGARDQIKKQVLNQLASGDVNQKKHIGWALGQFVEEQYQNDRRPDRDVDPWVANWLIESQDLRLLLPVVTAFVTDFESLIVSPNIADFVTDHCRTPEIEELLTSLGSRSSTAGIARILQVFIAWDRPLRALDVAAKILDDLPEDRSRRDFAPEELLMYTIFNRFPEPEIGIEMELASQRDSIELRKAIFKTLQVADDGLIEALGKNRGELVNDELQQRIAGIIQPRESDRVSQAVFRRVIHRWVLDLMQPVDDSKSK